jgi:hypothetical protein
MLLYGAECARKCKYILVYKQFDVILIDRHRTFKVDIWF